MPAMQPLAPCARMEPQWPMGMKPWGKLRVPIKCVAGPVLWKVYLPVTVKAWGRAPTARSALPAGTIVDASHLVMQDVDFASHPLPPLGDMNVLVGRTLARSLESGQAVRQADLKQRQWFSAGDTVRIVSIGNGFSVVGEGTAISSGLEGLPVRIRMGSGRVVTGLATANHEVRVSL
jgi:flagellar basal body P-ring formation protein FlgA